VVCIIATNVAPPELLWRPNRRTHFGVRAVRLFSDAMVPEPMHAAQVAAAPNVLFDQSKIVSRDLHRQTDSQTGKVFVQDRFLSRDRWIRRQVWVRAWRDQSEKPSDVRHARSRRKYSASKPSNSLRLDRRRQRFPFQRQELIMLNLASLRAPYRTCTPVLNRSPP